MEIRKILFPTDFSPCADQALAYALFMARMHGAEIDMLHAVVLHDEDPHNPAYHFPDVEAVYRRVQEAAAGRMAELLADRGGELPPVRQVQRRGVEAAAVILEHAAEEGVDLIVMGTHGRRGLGRALLGSVAEHVVRHARCPVLTVREREDGGGIEAIERVLAPVDFSSASRQAAGRAIRAAATYGARVDLLHVVEQPIYPQFYYPAATSSALLDLPAVREQAREALEDLVRALPAGDVEVAIHIVEGPAAASIVQFAEDHGTDLILLATHGLSGLAHLLLGSVAERVARLAPCPVLTVKVGQDEEAK